MHVNAADIKPHIRHKSGRVKIGQSRLDSQIQNFNLYKDWVTYNLQFSSFFNLETCNNDKDPCENAYFTMEKTVNDSQNLLLLLKMEL